MATITAMLAAKSDPELGIVLALAQDPAVHGTPLTAAALMDWYATKMGVNSSRDPHKASNLVRNPLQFAKMLGRLQRKASAVVSIEQVDGPHHCKLWVLTPRVPYGGGDSEPVQKAAMELTPRPDVSSEFTVLE